MARESDKSDWRSVVRSIHDFSKVYLHRIPVDGRKQINGLASIVEHEMEFSPFDEILFAFTNRRRRVIKILYWDRTGFALWMKRLEEDRFRWPLKMEEKTVTLTSGQLAWLLEGIDITRLKPHETLSYGSVS
jgi:transposase